MDDRYNDEDEEEDQCSWDCGFLQYISSWFTCFESKDEEAGMDDLYDTEDLQLDPVFTRTRMPSIAPVVSEPLFLVPSATQAKDSTTRLSRHSMWDT